MSESEETADTKVEKVAETAKSEEGEAPPAAAEEPQSTGKTETKVQPSEVSVVADNEGPTSEQPAEEPTEGKDTSESGANEEGTTGIDAEKKEEAEDGKGDKKEEEGTDEVEGTLKSGEVEGDKTNEEDKLGQSDKAGDNETREEIKTAEGDIQGEKESVETLKEEEKEDGDQRDAEAGDEATQVEDKGGEGQEVVTSEQQASSDQPAVVSAEGEDKKESDEAAKEEEKGGEEEEEEEEEMVFDYDYEQMKSTPEMVNVSTSDMLTLFHSFGYECQKRSNLAVLAKDVVLYAAGNLVVLLRLDTQEQLCFRSLGGGGIGAIAVHPSQAYFAVGEKSIKPVIAIYTYPELKLHRLLRDGTEELYSHMDFSPGDGKLLASVGGNPDFMLTVWDWEREKTVLRSKAFSQDIYRVTFSPENAHQLTTSGTGHIRFWKMATTFTGLKLQGQLGKFGRIEISDISAYVELPDGKVLSGTEWGNMLLWDGGFIKVEISRKGKKYCHNGMIEAIYLDEGELISAGADGYIRVWDFETIDNADISDENVAFEMDPLTEIKIGNDVSLKTLSRSVDPDTPTLWYAQDAGGAMWKIDIVVSHTRKPPEKLISFHSGEITGLDCSPVSHQAASISQNGSVRVYDLPTKQLLCHSQYTSGGSSLIWAPVSIDPSATTIFAGFSDGVVRVVRLEERVSSQSARHRKQQKYQLTLLNAVKPHTKPVTCLAVDAEGKMLASGSKDNTVFFLNVQDQYSPIGFIHTPAPVTTMQWTSEKEGSPYLLVCCEDGSMMEVAAPDVGQYDTSKTYHLDQLKFTSRKFTSIKDRLRAEEEEARQAAERAKKQREKEAKKQRRREELGEDYVSEEEEEEEEEEEKEGEGEEEPVTEDVEKPKGPSSILSTFFSHQDETKFWVSMSGYDAGYLYQCSMEGAEPESQPYEAPQTIPVPPINGSDLPLHSMTFSSSGEYFLTGTSNGCIRIHELQEPHSLSSLTSYWSLSVHDNHSGAVTHLVTSFDDKYVLSGGADGNLFVFEGNFPTAAQRAEAAKEAKIPAESGTSAKDIEDPEHYSVEDAKQKAEHDRMMKLAEEKKQHVRRQIASLRRAFVKLQQKAAQLPEHLRLDKKEFVMDPDIERQMKARAEERVKLVRKEMAWETEKHTIALRKLQKKYKDVIDCERITVWSFSGEKQVSSFRTARPSPAFLQLIEEFSTVDSTATPSTAVGQKRKISVRKKSIRDALGFAGADGEGGVAGVKEEDDGEGEEEEELFDDKQKSKQEVRRLKKEMRKKEWEELYSSKPDEKQEDPEEARLLEQARENLGDYKLKTASDYVVPERQRVTTKSKRKQLMMLRAQIFDTKKEYNKKLIALRDWKLQLVDKIAELVKRLEELHAKLPPSLQKPIPPVPVIRPEEVPERRYHYTKETLLKFKEEKKAKDEAERLKATGAGDGFFGGFGGGGDGEGEGGEGGGEGGNGDQENKEQDGQKKEEQDGAQAQEEVQDTPVEGGEVADGEEAGQSEAVDSGRPSSPAPKAQTKVEVKMTELEVIIQKEQLIRNEYEQDCLLTEINQLKREFDEALFRLRHTKVHLDIDMVAADLKHITQFEELQLLKEFEKKETIFTTRYNSRKQEKQDLESKMEEVQWAVADRETILNKLIEQEKALEQSFLESVGENNKFKDFLLKVFRKKIKRAKRKQEEVAKEGERDGEDDEGSEEESDSDYLSSSEDESEADGELDDSICPAGCDHTLFDQACEKREKRLDMEDAIAEEKKALESQKKELEGLKKKAKTMDVHVKTALNELQAFQLKKQQRLNELDQVAVLRLHQILHYGKDGAPPTSIGQCLVFPASSLNHLEKRIGELTTEKQQEKKRYKELRQHHVKLNREKKEMQSKIAVLNEKADEAMMLKFGRVVDLDRLEGLSVNHIVGELRGKLRKVEQKREQDVASIETKINAEKRRLAAVTRENTQRLNRLHELRSTNDMLEKRLNARQKSMSKDVAGGVSHLDEDEKQRLVQIVQIQASEIDALRQEIQVLLRKGGNILPPSQPPTGAVHPNAPGTLPPIH